MPVSNHHREPHLQPSHLVPIKLLAAGPPPPSIATIIPSIASLLFPFGVFPQTLSPNILSFIGIC